MLGGVSRLTSIISYSAISSSALSMMAAPGLPEYGAIVVLALVFLYSFKEIFSGSKFYGKALDSSLNMGIIPLAVCFCAAVVFRVAGLF